MTARDDLPLGLPVHVPAYEPMTAEQYQREAIATAQSEAMNPDTEPAEDLG